MRMKAFRLDEQTIAEMEEVRDHQRFPTQSDFVRTAIRRLIREERHRLILAQIRSDVKGKQLPPQNRPGAEPMIEDWFDRLERADRGDL